MAAGLVVVGLFFMRALLLTAASPSGFSLELIHRDSTKSPFRDPMSDRFGRLRASANRSLGRAAYLSSRAGLTSLASRQLDAGGSTIQSDIVPNSFEYLMRVSIGKSDSVLAIADTGSDLIWLQCNPCDSCYNQTSPLFNPSESPTYKPLPCTDPACDTLPKHMPDCYTASQQCSYRYSYGDRSYVVGNLATETLTFGGVAIPGILFGCTHESAGTFDSASAGLVGLGGGSLSLITQLGDTIGHRFSYCLPPLMDGSGSSSRISFGSSAIVSGSGTVSTPIIRGDPPTFIYVNLERISVASSSIAVKSAEAGSGAGGNIIVDSGTTLTLLDDETLQSLIGVLSTVVKLPPASGASSPMSLCFAAAATDEGSIPDITLHFQGGADVVLKPMNAFLRADERTLCLAMVSNRGVGGLSILGNVAQQNFNIEYDLSANKLTFAPADCTHRPLSS